jgi:hypothetical protein
MSFNPKSLRQMESSLRDSNPDMEFVSTMKFGFGALTMDLVDFAFVHDRHFDVSKISRADVGIYELKHPLNVDGFTVPQGDYCPQREVIVRVMEEHLHVEIAVCMRNDKLTGLAVFVLEPTEIVIVNARGNVQALVTAMFRDNVNRKSRDERRTRNGQEQGPVVSLANPVANALPPS